MIGQTVSHYHILKELGEGGMGVVYAAEDTHLKRSVAIKFLNTSQDETQRKRFLREARSVSKLSHPHIATVFDYGETLDGLQFTVMELVDGKTLSELLQEDTLELSQAVKIILDIAEALEEAHGKGIIHRDIKPSNVMVSGKGYVKVLDFGLAKQVEFFAAASPEQPTRSLHSKLTSSGVIVGTPLYFSPEQAKGEEADVRSDLFTLGAVMYECLTGRQVFSGSNVIEICVEVMRTDPPPPSHFNRSVPPDLDRITMKALAKKPAERYQSAEELIKDLRLVYLKLQNSDNAETLKISKGFSTLSVAAWATMSTMLRRPRYFVPLIPLVFLLAAFGVWRAANRPYSPSTTAQYWYDVGTAAIRNGSYYQASMALQKAIEADNKFALAHARLAETNIELDYRDKAREELLHVAGLVPNRSALSPTDSLYIEAITATAAGDLAGAIGKYNDIVRLEPDRPQAYLDLGRAYERNNDTQNALANYERAAQLSPEYASAFLRLGILHGRQRDQTRSDASFDKAEELYRAQGNIEGRAEVHYQRGFLLRNQNKIADAHRQLQKARELAMLAGNEAQQILSSLQLSSVAFAENNTSEAQSYAQQAVELAQSKGMENITARGLVDLGNAFFGHGEADQAEKYFRQALEFAQKHKDHRNEARARLSLGSSLIKRNETEEGLRNVEQALEFYQRGDYRTQSAQALILIGRARRQKGDYEAAVQAFTQQLQIAEQSRDDAQKVLAHEGLGSVLAQQDRYPEALAHYKQVYDLSKSLGDQRSVSYSLSNQGNVLWPIGDYEAAGAMLEQAADLAGHSKSGDKTLLATIHLIYAEMALSKRNLPEVKTRIQQAGALASSPDAALSVETKRILGLALVLSGAKPEGQRLCEVAVDIARNSKNPYLYSRSLLSLGQAVLENGDAQKAREMAIQAQEIFSSTGALESAWRAHMLMAHAARRLGERAQARESAAQAERSLAQLQQSWGAEFYQKYLTRPDVQSARRQLSEFAIDK